MAIVPKVSSNTLIYGVRLTGDPNLEYRYVGLTSTGTVRMNAHLSNAMNTNTLGYNTPAYRWMRKHYLHVSFDVLEYVSNIELLALTEMKWIHILKTRGHRLLNLTDGGEGTWGHQHSVETREKIAAKNRGRTPSPETRAKMSESRKGKSASAETRAKLSIANSGERNAMYGKKLSSERKAAIALAHTGTKRSAETRKKMSLAAMGKSNAIGHKRTEEFKANLSASRMGENNPNYGKKPSEETRAKMALTRSKQNHIRWHVNREISKEECIFCTS